MPEKLVMAWSKTAATAGFFCTCSKIGSPWTWLNAGWPVRSECRTADQAARCHGSPYMTAMPRSESGRSLRRHWAIGVSSKVPGSVWWKMPKLASARNKRCKASALTPTAFASAAGGARAVFQMIGHAQLGRRVDGLANPGAGDEVEQAGGWRRGWRGHALLHEPHDLREAMNKSGETEK